MFFFLYVSMKQADVRDVKLLNAFKQPNVSLVNKNLSMVIHW